MCGIVGIMSKRKNGLFHADVDMFGEMLFANQLRGAHGTGIFYDIKKKADVFKGQIPSSVFLRSPETKTVFNDIVQKSTFVIGHNRHATKGAVSFENTHPFIEGPITLIHNGTLPYHKDLKDVEVDSHAICHSMGEIGYIETLKKIDGAFALVWFDERDGLLRFIRNTERPLHILETNELFVISSEYKLADWILARKSMTTTQVPISCKVGQLYTYNPHTGKLTDEEVAIKSKTYAVSNYYGHDKWFNNNYDSRTTSNPARMSDNNIPYIDVKVGDSVIFSPIDVNPHGKTFLLQGMAETIIHEGGGSKRDIRANESLVVKMYNSSEQDLNFLLDYVDCSGEVIQIIWKGGNKSVVVKDVRPLPILTNTQLLTTVN